jgi:hypothetical protein
VATSAGINTAIDAQKSNMLPDRKPDQKNATHPKLLHTRSAKAPTQDCDYGRTSESISGCFASSLATVQFLSMMASWLFSWGFHELTILSPPAKKTPHRQVCSTNFFVKRHEFEE